MTRNAEFDRVKEIEGKVTEMRQLCEESAGLAELGASIQDEYFHEVVDWYGTRQPHPGDNRKPQQIASDIEKRGSLILLDT